MKETKKKDRKKDSHEPIGIRPGEVGKRKSRKGQANLWPQKAVKKLLATKFAEHKTHNGKC